MKKKVIEKIKICFTHAFQYIAHITVTKTNKYPYMYIKKKLTVVRQREVDDFRFRRLVVLDKIYVLQSVK